jgi:putative membrane protein
MMGYGRGLGYGWNMMGDGWFGGALMLLFGLLVLAGIAVLVVWAVRVSSGKQDHSGPGPTPSGTPMPDEAVATARRRFASGEITKEQFDEIMRALSG